MVLIKNETYVLIKLRCLRQAPRPPRPFHCVSVKFEEIYGMIAQMRDISRFSSLETHHTLRWVGKNLPTEST